MLRDMARVTQILHKGVSVHLLDLRDLKPGEFKGAFAEAARVIVAAPLRSVRIVTDVEGARFDPATVAEFERFISEVTPHCAANAVVGVTGIRRVAWLGLKAFYKCPAELSPTVEAGKDWVAAFKG